MAIYRTNTEELTSIADAIREKTGDNSPLIYPTGFISAISGISTGSTVIPNWRGHEVTLLNENIYNQSFKLNTTTYPNWTPSTSSSIIKDAENVSTTVSNIDLANYDYYVQTTGHIEFVYPNGTSVLGGSLEGFYNGYYIITSNQGSASNLASNTYAGAAYFGTALPLILYTNTSGNNAVTYSGYGIYFTHSQPSLSGTTLTVKTPVIRAATNAQVFSSNMASALDTANTTITVKINIYRCNSKSAYYGGLQKELIDMYQSIHNS